jgi:hypothetical protein
MSALAGMGMLGDASGWPEPIRLAIDAAFLAAAGALSFALWHGRGHLPAAAQPD